MGVAYQDYYKILEVNRKATQAEIQKAYRKLARRYHPDVNKEAGAEDQFKKVTEAYEVLKNPETRRKYDQLGSNWKAGDPFKQGAGPQAGFDFSEAFSGTGFSSFFDALFGQGRQSSPAGHDHFQDSQNFGAVEQEASIEVTLEESFNGVEKEIIIKSPPHSQEADRRIKVRIPPGAIDNTRIRLKGQGRNRVRGARAGDLILNVRLKPHPIFHTEKYDLVGTLKLSPWEAALGARIAVKTLGNDVMMTIPAGTQGGQRLRLKGKGLPRPKKDPGDIFYDVKIMIPMTLSEEEKKQLELLSRVSKFNPRN